MEERNYPTIEEKIAQKKAAEKQRKLDEKAAKKQEKLTLKEAKKQKASPITAIETKEENKKIEKKPKKGKKTLVFFMVLITLFCLSFTSTAYIIMNANKLTYDNGNNEELQKQIEELEELLAEKEEEIEKLTVELTNSSSPSFSAPVSR